MKAHNKNCIIILVLVGRTNERRSVAHGDPAILLYYSGQACMHMPWTCLQHQPRVVALPS